MKILLLNQTFYPDSVATAQQLTDLALYLKDKGHQATVVCGRRGYDKREQIYPAYEDYKGIRIFRVGSTGLGKLTLFRRIVDSLTFDVMAVWRLLKTEPQDVVVSYTSPPLVGFLGTLFCLIKGGRSVQWLMDINPDAAIAVGYVNGKSPAGRFLTWALDFTLKYSHHVVVLDRWMKEKAVSHGAAANKISIVPPWPAHKNSEVVSFARRQNPFRTLHGLGDKFVIQFSGNHSIVHPLETLLGGALKLRDNKDVLFLFIGSGLRVDEVTAFKKQHALDGIVQLPHQPRELLSQSLSSADLHIVVLGKAVAGLVHTSKIYGVLATGKPYIVIAPKASHLGDLLAECPGGFLVEHGDLDGFVQTVDKARRLSESELEKISQRNRSHISERCAAEISLGVFLREVIENTPSIEVNSVAEKRQNLS